MTDSSTKPEKPEKQSGVTHDVAARLLGITPGELTTLVTDGHVRRADRNIYPLPALVGDYCAYLRGESARAEAHPKQVETASHLDLTSDRSVRDLEEKFGLQGRPYTLSEIRVAYIRRLREQAAGRATEGDLDLPSERAALAKVQRERIELQNAVTRRELAPVAQLEHVLFQTAAKITGILEAVPGRLYRRLPELGAAGIALLEEEIAGARNAMAAIRFDDVNPAAEAGPRDATELRIDGDAGSDLDVSEEHATA